MYVKASPWSRLKETLRIAWFYLSANRSRPRVIPAKYNRGPEQECCMPFSWAHKLIATPQNTLLPHIASNSFEVGLKWQKNVIYFHPKWNYTEMYFSYMKWERNLTKHAPETPKQFAKNRQKKLSHSKKYSTCKFTTCFTFVLQPIYAKQLNSVLIGYSLLTRWKWKRWTKE